MLILIAIWTAIIVVSIALHSKFDKYFYAFIMVLTIVMVFIGRNVYEQWFNSVSNFLFAIIFSLLFVSATFAIRKLGIGLLRKYN